MAVAGLLPPPLSFLTLLPHQHLILHFLPPWKVESTIFNSPYSFKFSSPSSSPYRPQSFRYMDRLKKPTNLSKLKKRQKQPLKIVYISSPMKVETSAAQFRALVQELTGQESDVARFYSSSEEEVEVEVEVADQRGISTPPAAVLAHDCAEPGHDQQPYGLLEDVVAPNHVMEGFTDFMSSSLCYEPHLDMFIRNLDAF